MNDFLFVCQENRLRSPTCEHVARLAGYTADSAGTALTAVRPLTMESIMRANNIICMEPFHRRCVDDMVRAYGRITPLPIDIWNIPDIYDYCQPELIGLVTSILRKWGQK